jgi:hypothetical protein
MLSPGDPIGFLLEEEYHPGRCFFGTPSEEAKAAALRVYGTVHSVN